MRKNTPSGPLSRARLVLGLLLVGLLVVSVSCKKKKIAFTVQRLATIVFTGSSPGSLASLNTSSAQSLPSGHHVKTDASGEALLQGKLDNNKTCKIYVFQSSGLVTRGCPKSQVQQGVTATCQEEGQAVYQKCKGSIQMTPSATVQVKGSWHALTYLPDQEITLVMVAEGEAEVWPITDLEDRTEGRPVPVVEGQLLFTAPDDVLREIAQLPPREPLPLEVLPAIAEALRIEPWIDRVIDRARQDGLDFPSGGGDAPPPQEGVFAVRAAGGPLDDGRVQEAIAIGVDWTAVVRRRFPDAPVGALLDFPDLVTTTDQVPYDPDRSWELMAEAGYADGFFVLGLVSEEDGELLEAARLVTAYLSEMGLQTDFRIEPAQEVEAVIKETVSSGEAVVWLAWE